jgi:hypothetical protein
MTDSAELVHKCTSDRELTEALAKASRSSCRHVIPSTKAQAKGGAGTSKYSCSL